MEKRNIVRNQKGFTLIEIIAVLVILGVLAAVAVPKYMDLQKNAKKMSLTSVSNELQARANLEFGNNQLKGASGNTSPTLVTTFAQLQIVDADFEDFDLTPETFTGTTWTGTDDYLGAVIELEPETATTPAKVELTW